MRSILVAVVLLACAVVVEAQQGKKVYRIGYLASGTASSDSARITGLRIALRERGYIEGENIAIEYRYGEETQDKLPEIATELVRLKAAVIVVAGGNRVVQAAKDATKIIPIVMVGSGSDPVAAGFVESLARPGGNITGITNFDFELGGKRLELLKEAVPKLARVAVLYDPTSIGPTIELKENLPGAALPAIREDTLYSSRPQLKNPKDGDLIDFYGPCDYDPLGFEQIRRQRADVRRDRRTDDDD
jgi:ABC-type uncharacterized transport system substrate-binding protein